MIWELDEDNEQCVKWHHFETNIKRILADKVAKRQRLGRGTVACVVPSTRALSFTVRRWGLSRGSCTIWSSS